MYSQQPNGADSATINPAALSSELLNTGTRGVKRSRSPDSSYPDLPGPGNPGDDDSHARKRARPIKTPSAPSGILQPSEPAAPAAPTPSHSSNIIPPMAQVLVNPQQVPPTQASNVSMPPPAPINPYTAPPQTSPRAKPNPPKTTIKALPTVRDHTTDQLGPGGDEYLPREIDEAGEKKVAANGELLGGRQYRCRTFLVPNRADKLFMLATECARVLGYRDSYLLFNKNRSLYKIIANQEEKDDLVQQDILPFSYRSRQIAIVTARSMFRQFGSRMITNGRRVRDDYWESKARKQGFTEDDLAGEKRPGGAKARAAEAANNSATASFMGTPHHIVYNQSTQFGEPPPPQLVQPGMLGATPGSATRMPMITLGSELNDRSRDYSNLLKAGPRQEITGPPYHDRTQPTPLAEIQPHAHQAADYNRSVNQGRDMRNEYMQNVWRRTHEQPTSGPTTLPQPIGASDSARPSSRTGAVSSSMMSSQSPQLMMTAPSYPQPLHNPASQTSIRGMTQPPVQSSQRPTSLPGTTGNLPSSYSYQSPAANQMWQHQSPQGQHSYGSTYTTQQPQTSPHQPQATNPQMRSSSQVQPPMQFPGIPGMAQGYSAHSQSMYPADHQTPRQYMQPAPSASPSVTQGWSNSQSQSQWWPSTQPQ